MERISIGFHGQEGLRDQESLLEPDFFSPLDAGDFGQSWILPALLWCAQPSFQVCFYQAGGVRRGPGDSLGTAWGQLAQAQGSASPPLLAAGRKGAEPGFKLSLNLKNLKSAFLDLGNDKEQGELSTIWV